MMNFDPTQLAKANVRRRANLEQKTALLVEAFRDVPDCGPKLFALVDDWHKHGSIVLKNYPEETLALACELMLWALGYISLQAMDQIVEEEAESEATE